MTINILIVSSYFPPHIGGVEVVAQQQARSLARAGHTVVVVTTRTPTKTPGRERADGYDVVRLPANNLLERRTGVPYPVVGARFLRTLRRLVRWSDVVHVHDVLYQPVQAAAFYAHRFARPLYVTQHIGHVHHPRRAVRTAARLSARVAGGLIWRRARRVVAHNPMFTDYLLAHGVPRERIVTTPNGIETAVFAPGPVRDNGLRARLGLPDGRPLALFVGRLVPRKGYEQLIAAADDAYHIVLAGSGKPARPLPDGVFCTGPVPRADLVDLYRLADVFVLPSLGEIFPLVVQEAMACGLPIVATYDERYDSYGIDRGRLCLIRPEAAEIRRALRAVVGDPDLAHKMSEYSRHLAVQHFDWQTNQQSLLGLYARDAAPQAHRHDGRDTRTRKGTSCRSASSF